MKPTVLLAMPIIHPAGRARLLEGCRLVDIDGSDAAEMAAALPHADAVYLYSPARLDRAALETAERLKVITIGGAGYDNVDADAASDLGILLTNQPGKGALSVAEHTVGMMLCLAKRLMWTDEETRAGRFDARWDPGFVEISGKTVAVVGFGHIGRHVARICRHGFGMRVLAVGREGADVAAGPDAEASSLADALPRADFVSLNVPLTAATRGMFGADQFAAMKPGAFLVNTARGGVVDEAALLAALRDGRLAGAAVDVFADEPPRPDNPLFASDKVIVSPHNAGNTQDAFRRLAMSAAEDILRALRGERPEGLVNTDAWNTSRAANRDDSHSP
jgi:D-3-phosphoglycerate dehydrogenase / 2-oxoglutarate reductase